MSLLLAAIGATIAALLEVTFAGYPLFGAAHAHPVLVLTVAWAVASGIEGGMTVAVVGGLVLDALSGRPFGVSALVFLLAAGAAVLVGQALVRIRPVVAILMLPVFSLVASMLIMAVSSALAPVGASGVDVLGTFGPGAVIDTAVALVVGPLAVLVQDRLRPEERVDW
jgi:rod shape-determining protein MreD